REHDDLRVLVESARQHDAEHAPDLVRQEADQDQQRIARELAERTHRQTLFCNASRSRCAAKASTPPTIPVHIKSRPTPRQASSGASTSPATSATQSAVTRALRTADIRNDMGDRNSSPATSRPGSVWAR